MQFVFVEPDYVLIFITSWAERRKKMKISFIQQTNEKKGRSSKQWFIVHSWAIIPMNFFHCVLIACLRASSSFVLFAFFVEQRQARGARKGHVMRERTTVDSPFACAYSLTNPLHYQESRRGARAEHVMHWSPPYSIEQSQARRMRHVREDDRLTRISHVPRARLLDLSPSLFAPRFFAFPLTESLTHRFKITRNARSTANIYWKL